VLSEQDERARLALPDPDRAHDVTELTAGELERARRDLRVSLALSLPGSTVSVPILARLRAIDAELADRTGQVPGP
jgi:hypothetical protein